MIKVSGNTSPASQIQNFYDDLFKKAGAIAVASSIMLFEPSSIVRNAAIYKTLAYVDQMNSCKDDPKNCDFEPLNPAMMVLDVRSE